MDSQVLRNETSLWMIVEYIPDSFNVDKGTRGW